MTDRMYSSSYHAHLTQFCGWVAVCLQNVVRCCCAYKQHVLEASVSTFNPHEIAIDLISEQRLPPPTHELLCDVERANNARQTRSGTPVLRIENFESEKPLGVLKRKRREHGLDQWCHENFKRVHFEEM